MLRVITVDNAVSYINDRNGFLILLQKYQPYLSGNEVKELIKIFILKDNGGVWVDSSITLTSAPDWLFELEKKQGLSTFGSAQYEAILFTPTQVQIEAVQ